MIPPASGSRVPMFKHRRVRLACVLLIGWAALTAMERWAEHAPWSAAARSGLLWSCVIAGTWWFAEMTQGWWSGAEAAREEAPCEEEGPPVSSAFEEEERPHKPGHVDYR
ncbi:hypothetical protein GCM10010272_32280 [Streptomyces lateritius]|nr:hypothetical protein GCM10010272_32280 [Streptomyces lateritius]